MEFYFSEKKITHKTIFININKYYSVDILCSCVLAKIFLSLKCNCKVVIVSKYFQGSSIFLLSQKKKTKKDINLSFDMFSKNIIVQNQEQIIEFEVDTNTLSEYFFNLIVKYNYVIDYELIGFYTLVGMKTSLGILNDKQKKQTYLKLLKIMNKEQFYTLEYNVDQLIEKIDMYVV